jgi:sarcosine oxidase subunit alpha
LKIVRAKPLSRLLVGFTLAKELTDVEARRPKECHLIIEHNKIVGRVTSVTRSPTLNQVIGLAFVAPDRSKPGTPFEIRLDDGTLVQATVVETPLYDPQNQRQAE